MSDIKLLSCPFCGGPGRIEQASESDGTYFVECPNCSATSHSNTTDLVWSREEAADEWNQREPMPREREIVDGYYQKNRLIYFLFEAVKNGSRLDLNLLWHMMEQGMIGEDEMREFYQLIGYKKSGYDELFNTEEDDE